MAVSAASTYALATLARKDDAFVRQALADVGAGDPLALQALAEKTGIADPAELKEAARLYLDQKLDVIFAGAGDARAKVMTGGDAQPSFAATAGGVGAGRMNAFIGLRGGGAAEAALAGELKRLVGERAAKIAERAPIAAERETTVKARDGLELNRREKVLGRFAFLLFADGDKGKKGSELKDQIDALDERIRPLDEAIEGFTTQMHESTAKHLRLQNDRDFIALDVEHKAASQAKGALDGLAKLIRETRSALSSAESAERSEQWAEQSAEGKPQGSWEAQNERWQEMNAQMAVSRAQGMMRTLQDEARSVSDTLRGLGKSANLGNVYATDFGKTFDVIADALGMDSHDWFWGTDAMVIRNIQEAERQIDALGRNVQNAQRSADAEHASATAARTGYLENVENKLLA